MTLRPGIKGVVFDLDNTLYPEPAGIYEVICEASGAAAVSLGFPGTQAEARAIMEKEWREYGTNIGIAFERDHGISRKDYLRERHAALLPVYLPLVKPDDELTAAINRLAEKMPVAVLTHGTQFWGEKITEHLGMKPAAVLGIDHPEIDFRMKNKGPEPFLAAAKALDLSPENIAVVEDSASNLVHAFRLNMQTILVHWGRPPPEKPAHVETMVSTLLALA